MAAGGTALHGTSDQKFGAEQPFKPHASKAAVYSLQFAEKNLSSSGAPHAHKTRSAKEETHAAHGAYISSCAGPALRGIIFNN